MKNQGNINSYFILPKRNTCPIFQSTYFFIARSVLKREIDATDCQIDALVYELYGLSEEDIKIVEDSVGVK